MKNSFPERYRQAMLDTSALGEFFLIMTISSEMTGKAISLVSMESIGNEMTLEASWNVAW